MEEIYIYIYIVVVAKIYNALLLNCYEPITEKILRKNKDGLQRKWSTTSQILTICWILRVCAKNLEAIPLLVDFSKAFDSIHRWKMKQILLANGLPKETVTAIMMLYKNTKVKVHSLDGDTYFFDIVAGVLQGDTLTPYLLRIYLDYVLWVTIDLMKENGFTLKKSRSRQYPAETISDADFTNDSASGKHLSNPHPCCIVWSRQQKALASIWIQTKQSTCVLIK